MGSQAKKRTAGRVKRQQIEAEDGWTVITRGSSKVSLVNGKDKGRSAAKNDGEQLDASPPTHLVENLTAEKLLTDFRALQERWNDTALARQIEEILGKREWYIRDTVCIGIGSFSRDWEHRWRSLWQLVLYIAVVQHLRGSYQGEAEEHKINIWAQDPALTGLDVDFLGRLGVEVMKGGIEAHISASSFVYSPFVDWFLLLPTFLCYKASPKGYNGPVLYIGNEILDDYTLYAQTEKKKERLNECNELGKAFLAQKKMVKLRDFDLHAQALNGMVVYWMMDNDW